ncbi:MAG: cytidine/deoxycytidylate deaminase family protein [Thermaerobacter sp.]|nr:dCMP deaminase [Bacillota bacterium]REJ37773.1 MAG: dCMP deaminase [Bacillota bacterium]
MDATTGKPGNGGRPPSHRRPSWDEYFLGLADAVAARSTCTRRAVGAVIVRDRRILATGYNGSPPGFPHCLDVGCLMVDGHCVRTVHAEMNAVVQAALHGVSIKGATVYCTSFPCLHCAKVLIGAGVERVVYRDPYHDPIAEEFFAQAGVKVERLQPAGAAPGQPAAGAGASGQAPEAAGDGAGHAD